MTRSDTLTVSTAARNIARELLLRPGRVLRAPPWYSALTAAMLPPPLRDGFDLPFGEEERSRAERALTRVRHLYPLLPSRLRCVAPYHERWRGSPAIHARICRRGSSTVFGSAGRCWTRAPRTGKSSATDLTPFAFAFHGSSKRHKITLLAARQSLKRMFEFKRSFDNSRHKEMSDVGG